MSAGGFTELARDVISDALIGGTTYERYNNANAYLGVGNGDDAFDETDTDLQGGSTVRLPMLATYPQRTDNVLTFEAEADGSTANFAWDEWGVFNHSSTGQMLCRFVQDLGTKGAGTTWRITATVTTVLPS